jgi:hypothetical protein
MPFLPWLVGGLFVGGAAGTILGINTNKIVTTVVIGGVAYYLIKGKIA